MKQSLLPINRQFSFCYLLKWYFWAFRMIGRSFRYNILMIDSINDDYLIDLISGGIDNFIKLMTIIMMITCFSIYPSFQILILYWTVRLTDFFKKKRHFHSLAITHDNKMETWSSILGYLWLLKTPEILTKSLFGQTEPPSILIRIGQRTSIFMPLPVCSGNWFFSAWLPPQQLCDQQHVV